MTAPLGSKLAQLANARKQASQAHALTEEEIAQRAADELAAKAGVIHQLLLPHVQAFNEAVEASDRISLELASPLIRIKQHLLNLLSIEVKSTGAAFRRSGGAYTSDDYFTFGTDADGAMTFSNFGSSVKKPLDGNQYAEIVLMEALGLNEE
jgi:hypothetical protein